MKRLFTLLLIAFAALSCEMIDEKLDDLLENKNVVIFAEGTELSVDVPSKQTVLNYKFESTLDWEVKTEAEWLEIDPMSGKAGKDIKIQIKVAKNKDKDGRTGYADLTLSNDESYRITINQAGEGDENEDIVVDIPHNQIWYTSVDGEIVEPYSGEENNYADALTTFGANIVSNTYDDEKECWVIKFDSDVTTIGDWVFSYCFSLTSVTIPDSVTTIGDWAFSYCRSLTSVTIGDSVTTIGEYAFGSCYSLASVTIPDSVTTIGEDAFYRCESLTSVTIPDSVTTIGNGVFCSCGLTSVTIPDSVTTIGEGAFYGCGLTSVTIPNGVTTIGNKAFNSCSSLTNVTIGDSVTKIGEGAFEDCYSLTSVTIPNSVTMIGNYVFAWCDSLASVTIGDSVTTIGDYAFKYCSSLTSVTIPDSVTEIGKGAFCNCTNLQEFKGKLASEDGRGIIIDGVFELFAPAGLAEYTIPNSVTTIGDGAFWDCDSLTSVTIPDSVTTIGEDAFYRCYSLTSVTIPDSVTAIGWHAFNRCSNLQEFNGKFASEDGRCLIIDGVLNSFAPAGLTEYTIPDSVTTIGDCAFAECSSLTNVTIPDSVTTIGGYAFCDCTGLTSVTIPDSVTTIGNEAFSYCLSLTSVTIPDSVTTIGNSAFYYCSSLTSVYCKPTTPPAVTLDYYYDWCAFDENSSGRKIYVPMESVEAYKSAEGWSHYADAIEGYNF